MSTKESALNWPDDTVCPLGDGRFATCVDRPTSVEALQEVVRLRAAEGLAIYPQGGKTSLDYGGMPRRPGAAVDTTGLDRVIDYPVADMTITVEAGITVGALKAVLDAQGQRLEIDAPQIEMATIGGVYATNTTGPRRYAWGRPRDQIIGVGFVTADGNVVHGGGRVVKNVAGYDFPKLVTGSLGTLGVICLLTLKVRPKPETNAIVCISYESLATVAKDLETLNTSVTRPAAIEVFNRWHPPGVPVSAWSIVLDFEDNHASIAWQLDQIGRELSGNVAVVLKGSETEDLRSTIREYSAAQLGPISFVANVRYSELPVIAAEISEQLWAIQAHAGNGVIRAQGLSEAKLADLETDLRRIRVAVEAAGGNVIITRCPTDRKELLQVWGTPRADWAWSEKIKAALDPAGVMNPGRFVGKI